LAEFLHGSAQRSTIGLPIRFAGSVRDVTASRERLNRGQELGASLGAGALVLASRPVNQFTAY